MQLDTRRRRALDLYSREIRLLELFPGRLEDAVECRTYTVQLDAAPKYEALSYVWGDPAVTTSIVVDGKPFDATINLEVALRHIRKPDGSRILWVDAICIDQSNKAEKSHQVRLMREIYKNCESCLAWFGLPPTDEFPAGDIPRFFHSLSMLARPNDDASDLFEPEAEINLEPWFWKVKEQFQRCTWWTRIWTVQEAVLPSKCYIIWGLHVYPWAVLDTHDHEMKPLYEEVEEIANVRNARSHTDILYHFGSREASEPRDRIFALSGLIPPHHRHLVDIDSIDYDVDLIRLNFRTVVSLIRSSWNLEALCGQMGASPSTPGTPTWVTEWASPIKQRGLCGRTTEHLDAFRRFDACDSRPMRKFFPNGEDLSLTLDGIKIDTVSWTYQIKDVTHRSASRTGNEHNAAALWKQFSNLVDMRAWYAHSYPSMSNEDAFWRTLDPDDPEDQMYNIGKHEGTRFARSSSCGHPSESCPCAHLETAQTEHTFFKTDRGYFGLGICYVHGIMYGEAVRESEYEESTLDGSWVGDMVKEITIH